MKVALIGYGKMGRIIEEMLLERGHTVVGKFGSSGIVVEELKQADVAIEFSVPEAAYNNISTCLQLGVPVAIGTTGWLDRYQEIEQMCEAQNGAFLYASNFSLGVNLFFALNQHLANLMGEHDYQLELEEVHHIHKLDAPSGTAISLAEQIIEKHPKYQAWTLDPERKEQAIPIKAVRENEVPGTHIISYENDIDKIEIKHEAKNRKGFALGAVLAAEYLKGKKGVFQMSDVLNLKA